MDKINIYGVKPNIGVTHLAAMLVGFLNKMEYTAAYVGEDKGGAAEFKVPILDVPADELSEKEDYDYIVIDRGTRLQSAAPDDVNIIVTGIKPNERAAEMKIRPFSAAKNAIFVNNFAPEGMIDGKLSIPWKDRPVLPEEYPDFFGLLMTAYLEKKEELAEEET